MKEVSRSGVVIDTCTRCRGVWLDRGELENLAAVVVDQDKLAFPALRRLQHLHTPMHRTIASKMSIGGNDCRSTSSRHTG